MPRTGKDVTARPLSMWDPVYLGRDLYGDPVYITLAYRNLLLGGLPDAGKSNGVAQVLGHAALCSDVALWLFDGKETDLAFWEPLADRVIGHSLDDALDAVAALQELLDGRLGSVKAAGLEKINRESRHGFVLVVVDELALYTSVYGEPAQQKRFSAALRDLVSRGRAAGVIVVAATQRPSSDIVPTSLRDLSATGGRSRPPTTPPPTSSWETATPTPATPPPPSTPTTTESATSSRTTGAPLACSSPRTCPPTTSATWCPSPAADVVCRPCTPTSAPTRPAVIPNDRPRAAVPGRVGPVGIRGRAGAVPDLPGGVRPGPLVQRLRPARSPPDREHPGTVP
jgi:hypothetical protein